MKQDQPGPPPRAVVIHGHGHALAALQAAERSRRDAGGAAPVGLLLLSAPAAACFLGPGWWAALTTALRPPMQAVGAIEMLDCGDAAGRAMEALRIGLRRLILSPDCPQHRAVLARAAALGATLAAHRPEALDLAEPRAERRLDSWLGDPSSPPVPATRSR